MSINPIITFKAGACDLDNSTTPARVKPRSTPGYIYLYSEEELVHFCWRPRSAPLTDPELDLVMVPLDGTFTPYKLRSGQAPMKGRIFVLKFSSSSQRYLFYLQSGSQHPNQESNWFSPRDLKLGDIVNSLLQGEEVNVQDELADIQGDNGGDDDETMEDVEGTDHDHEHRQSGSGGAGVDATGGDVREEGEGPREGGADGGRAAQLPAEASEIVQNFLRSFQGNQNIASSMPATDDPFTTLADLLSPSTTVPLTESMSPKTVDHLLNYLPASLLLLAQDKNVPASGDVNVAAAQNAHQVLTFAQKKSILQQVLRSPHFSQSLSSLTTALRDGGLPTISEALNVKVEHGGFMRHGGVPLGGGQAVQAFVQGMRKQAEEAETGRNMDIA